MIEKLVTFPPLFIVVGNLQLFSEGDNGKYVFEGPVLEDIAKEDISVVDTDGKVLDVIEERISLKKGSVFRFEYNLDVEFI